MAFQFQGWADAPAQGAYTEHEVAPVFEQAIAETQFVKLADRVPYQSGESVTLPAISDLDVPTSDLLSESQSIPLDKLTITAKTISLNERGRGVMLSMKNAGRSPLELMNLHKKRLQEQLELSMDLNFATAFKASQLVYVPTGVASYDLATNGSAGAAAVSNINFYHLRKLRDLARRSYLMPKLEGNAYKLILSTAGFRSILDDPEAISLNQGRGFDSLMGPSRVKIEDVIVEECIHDAALDDNIGTNSDVAEGVFIAREAVKFAMGKMPTISYERHDHDRYISLAWWGDYAVGQSTDSANAGFARSIYITST